MTGSQGSNAVKVEVFHYTGCPILYYGFDGMSNKLYNQLAKECDCEKRHAARSPGEESKDE